MKRWLLIAMCVGGCAPAAAPPGPDRPKTIVTEETTAAIEHDLDEAERALQAALLRGEDVEATPLDDDRQPAPLGQTEGRREGVDRCSRACRALASMERSADRLCELAGDGDGRCRSAKQRVEAARDLVTRSCPACVD